MQDYGPEHMQVFWKHKSIGNISQLETRPLIGCPSELTNQRPGFQWTYVSNWLMLPKHFLHMIRPFKVGYNTLSKHQFVSSEKFGSKNVYL